MADSVQTLRDLVSGFNTMAMSVGLTPLSGQQQGLAMPVSPAAGPMQTAPMQAPKPPGQAAQEAVQQMEQQIQRATQSRQEASWHAGEFADRMQTIQASYIPITQADAYARILQQPGMGVPGIGQMPITTAPGMGVFRQQQMPTPQFLTPPMVPQIPPPRFTGIPMFGGGLQSAMGGLLSPFGGTPPAPMFTDMYERQVMLNQFRNQQQFAQSMANIPQYVGAAGTTLGTLGGAALGGRMAVRPGRLGLFTGALGAIAGGIGGYFAGREYIEPGLERATQATVTDPAMRTRAYGAQLQDLTRGFVVQGPELGPLGRGLGQRSGIQLAQRLQRMVEGGEMGNFNMRDVMRVASGAANQGMLDMAQNSEQIATQVRNVARGLQNFMRIAQEPDVQRAMQMMSGMRQMGLTIPESQIAMQNAQQFARMAGTTAQALMGGPGMQGAATFQRVGLTAGLGLQVGMGAAGLTQQAIAGGAFTPAQLALAGGPHGLTQTLTEASAASLSGQNRFQLLSTLSRAASGELMVDPERLKRVMSGHVSVSQQATMAAENIQRLAMGGRSPEQVLTEFASRTNELREEMGRRLGPMGGAMMTVRNALNIRQALGGNIDLGQAIRMAAPGMGANQVRSLQLMAESPGFWQGAQQQLLAGRPQMRAQEAARRQAMFDEELGTSAAWRRSWVARASRAVGGYFGQAWGDFRQGLDDMSQWWTEQQGGETDPATGARIVRTPERFQRSFGNAQVRRAIMQAAGSESVWRDTERLFEGQPARPQMGMSGWQRASTFWGLGRGAAQIYATAQGGAAGGIAASLLPESTATRDIDFVKALRITGGWDRSFTGRLGGWMAEHMPWAVSLGMMSMGQRDWVHQGLQALAISRAQSTERLAQQAREAGRLTETDVGALRRAINEDLPSAIKDVEGGTDTDLSDMEDIAVRAMSSYMSQNAASWSDQPYKGTTEEMKRAVIDQMVKEGKPRAVAERAVNTQWEGLSQLAIKRIKRGEGGKAAQSMAEKLADEPGFALQGKDLKTILQKAEKQEQDVMKLLGGARYAMKWWGGVEVKSKLTKRQQEALGSYVAQQDVSEDEIQLRLAAGLRARASEASEEDAEKLNEQAMEITKAVQDRMKERTGSHKAFQQLADRVAATPVEGDVAEAFKTVSEQIGAMPEGTQRALVSRLKKTAVGTRFAAAFAKGAARRAEEEGVTISEIRRRADPTTQEGRKLIQELAKEGMTEPGKQRLGGRGRGGQAEGAAVDQAESLAALATQIPKFREATEKLSGAADRMDRAMQAALLAKVRPGLFGF